MNREFLPLRITQHKRFVPYGTNSNFCYAKTSFMRKPFIWNSPHHAVLKKRVLTSQT